MRKKRIKPRTSKPEPITADNYRHDEQMAAFLRAQGYVLEVPRPHIKARKAATG